MSRTFSALSIRTHGGGYYLNRLGAKCGTAGEARKFPQDHDASRELSGADWKPIFLDLHQNKTLIRLSDLIIPRLIPQEPRQL